MWKKVLYLFIALSPLLAFTHNSVYQPAQAAPRSQSASSPLVAALYYTWFDENTWSSGRLSDLPAEPYVSRDRALMARHIGQAQAAGIDAFIVAWYGPNGNQTETNLSALLEVAAERNFKIGILFETDSPYLGGDLTGALQHALSVHANQPAYLRADGRPVIFFWRTSIYGLETWRSVRSQVDPGYSSLWVNEGVDTSYLAVFDAHYLYSNTWNPPADLAYTNQKFAKRVATASQTYGANKLWVATVMPGYNDLLVRPGVGFAKDREGGAYYQRSWQAAIASQPHWVVITSFNEWPEGSYIEPSAAYGDLFLGLTATGAQQFKAGGGVTAAALAAPPAIDNVPAAQPPVAPAAAPTQPPPIPPAPTTPTAFVNNAAGLNLRAGPGTEFTILELLPNGTALPITGSDPAYREWWQVSLNSQIGWVAAAYVQALGPLEQIATVTFVPVATTADSVAVIPTPTIAFVMPPAVSTEQWNNDFMKWK